MSLKSTAKVVLLCCFALCLNIIYSALSFPAIQDGARPPYLLLEDEPSRVSQKILEPPSSTSLEEEASSENAKKHNEALPARYHADHYKKSLEETLKARADLKTAFYGFTPYSGLNNQLMRFIGMVYLAGGEDFGQIIEDNLAWKDTYGHNDFVPHHNLWDVVHWNSFYPKLPRFVSYNKEQHPHLDLTAQPPLNVDGIEYSTATVLKYNTNWDVWENRTITNPQPIVQNPQQGFNKVMQLHKKLQRGKKLGAEKEKHFEINKEMLQGALKPHPFIQQVIDKVATELGAGDKGYMTLHARIEPDMLVENLRVCYVSSCQPYCHYFCFKHHSDRNLLGQNEKVFNFTEIVSAIYEKYPEPPVGTVLLQFNRALLEAQVKAGKKARWFHENNNYNLEAINKLVQEGMWGGKVNVVEAGSREVEEAGDPYYKYYSNIAGGIVNLFLAINSDIMIGTETSTYSVQAVNTRYYRGLKENHFYTPEGLRWVTSPENDKPYKFGC